MRLLLTSDSQTDVTNLDLCEIALTELLQAANKYKPDAIIHAGDLKEIYDRVPMLVVKFWVRAVRKIRDAGFRLIILKGNHDRLSQSADSKDWLDILRAAGAETVSQPKVKSVGDGNVAFLPYTSDKKQERQWAEELYAGLPEESCPKVLVFHTELMGAEMGPGVRAKGNTEEQLFANRYDASFGGHLHKAQKISEVTRYIGSPFCHDWGEADETKSILFWDSDTGVKCIKTKIPRWYNAEYLEQNNLTPEDGAYIRSKVPVTTKKITAQLRAEEERLQKLWASVKNLRFFVIPKLTAPETVEFKLTGATDLEYAEQYVAATLQEGAKFTAKQGVAYLVGNLVKIDSRGRCRRLRLLKVAASNVLSYAEVNFSYFKQGLVLLRGKNRDLHGRSNGAGKSNLLALLPVALFGETFKGQKNNQWANEQIDAPSEVKLVFRDEGGRKIEIVRGRPHKLELIVNGKNQSSGLTGKGKGETQGLIEEISGLDMRLLKNSVYIDQTIANGFTFGTQKDRMDLVNKLLDLEKFAKALQIVNQDAKKLEEEKIKVTTQAENLLDEKQSLELELEEYTKESEKTSWTKELAICQKDIKYWKTIKVNLLELDKEYRALSDAIDEKQADIKELVQQKQIVFSSAAVAKKELDRAEKLIAAGNCPQCGQPSKQVGETIFSKSQKTAEELVAKYEKLELSIERLEEKLTRQQTRLDTYQNKVAEADDKLYHLREKQQTLSKAAEEEQHRNAIIESNKTSKQKELNRCKRILEAAQHRLTDIDAEIELVEYAKKAFTRSGMPMYLAAGLCPVLNNAAEEFSEIFWQSRLGVYFSVVDGEFMVDIINPNGSQKGEGQSVGEAAMAGITTAFAVREAAPKSNLLILDEPGSGLDAQGAKLFAKGLLKLKDRIGTILLTTHNSIIENILAGEKTWTVIKEQGISRLQKPRM